MQGGWMKRAFLGSVAASALVAGLGAANANAMTAERPWQAAAVKLDAGPLEAVAHDALPLTPDVAYNAARGYGWTNTPATMKPLTRPDLARSRDAFTIDSVEADELGFRIDLPEGDWVVTFWMEAGLEDTSTAAFLVNGEARDLGWIEFQPPAEPRTDLRPEYRMYQGRVSVGDKGLELAWKGNKDKVRLNGLQFHRLPETISDFGAVRDDHVQMALRIREAGRYNSNVSLDAIVAELDRMLEEDPEDAFAAHWRSQVDMLARAEEYYLGLLGWEWATNRTGLSMFGRYAQAIMWIDGLLADGGPDNPLYERALFQRGRILYWLDREGYGQDYDGKPTPELLTLHERHPEDQLLAMYMNKDVDTPDSCDALTAPAAAPDWAVAQREVLCRTRLITHWWTNERQDPNGELGGKYGDDVEMLRWWVIPFFAGDETTRRGWTTLATGVWNSDRLEDGYFKKAHDVEHASEPISDTAPLLSYLDDPVYVGRLSNSARHFMERWTVQKDNGHRFFRTAWFGAHELDERPPRNRDVPMNGRAAKAVLFYAWASGDEAVIEGVHQWAKGWAAAAMSEAKGKPKGIVPPSVRASDEAINGDEPTWYGANMFWDYFEWSHESGQQIYDLLLFTWKLTGDESLLEPIFASADLIAAHLNDKAADPAVGSAAWAAKELADTSGFWSVLEQWRLLSGDKRYDGLLMKRGGPYIKFRLTGDRSHLVDAGNAILKMIRYNTPMRTSEALFTDRVYISQQEDGVDPVDQITGYLTGAMRTTSPYVEVSWDKTSEGFTALVSDATDDTLKVEGYLFDKEAQDIGFRVWRLAPGTYSLTVSQKGRKAKPQRVEITRRGEPLSVKLAGNAAYGLVLKREK